MELSLQAKLLRVIQEKEVIKIGGNSIIKLDVRILVATHRNLREEVKNGNFREDLYYRILGLPVWLPPLRERDNDIILIANYFLKEFCIENGVKKLKFSRSARDKLLQYWYPGNVRELKSIVDLAVVYTVGTEIEAEDIKFNSIINDEKIYLGTMTLKEYNFKIIRHMMEKYDGNVIKVAKKLDIGKSTIYRHLNEMKQILPNQIDDAHGNDIMF